MNLWNLQNTFVRTKYEMYKKIIYREEKKCRQFRNICIMLKLIILFKKIGGKLEQTKNTSQESLFCDLYNL